MENKINFICQWVVVFLIIMTAAQSCKKGNIATLPVASLTVTNAIISGKSIRIGSIVTSVANNGSAQLTLKKGEQDLYVWPVGDSAHPYFTPSKFYAEEQAVYSLFLAGQLPNATGIVVQDNIPYHTDSTCGIRFINLSPNSPPLNITLSTTPTVNQVSNLTYLQYTDFKLFTAKAANTSYIIQVRKSSDNTILMTYPLSTPFPRFTNVTLVIRGLVGAGSPLGLGVTRVNNDH
jgi:hypothetical protein